MTSNWSDAGQLPGLDEKRIQLVRGVGRVAGDRRVVVDGERNLTAEQAVALATGTRALMPPIPGLADAKPWDNRSITSAKEVPRRLLVLGGGAIGAEMAQAYRRLGSDEVTVVEGAHRLLGREEPFACEELRRAFEAEGMTVITGASVTAVRREGDDGPVVATLADGRELVGDELLVAVGRRPATDDLGLESVGLEPGRSVTVDDQMRAVDVPGDWLYAVGDCNGRALLTHMGKYQARLAADVIAGADVADVADHDMIPRITFTDPQVCAVGLTEEQARANGLGIRVVQYPTGGVAGAATLGDGVEGTSQLVIDEQRHVIVGATFTGPGVQELLHSATIAIVGEVPLTRLWHAVPSFPTLSEVWLRLLESYGL
jgi:pyruvate/2-oxoglutarate dehydrogenase complex dihydrolipoamide dehydrogenase (E3) component